MSPMRRKGWRGPSRVAPEALVDHGPQVPERPALEQPSQFTGQAELGLVAG